MDFNNTIPIYIQIMNDMKKKIVLGHTMPGEKLPSTRTLALEYGINPNTASRVYRELELENIIFTMRGKGTFVIESVELVNKLKNEMANQLLEDFMMGMKELGIQKEQIVNLIREYKKD